MLILIGRGLDLKEELELKGKRSESEAEGKDIAREFEVSFHCAVFKVWEKKPHRISGGNGMREPPVPIPNTEVKPLSADGTWLETARESRSSPDSKDIGKETYRYRYSSVAQWQSIRLLTEGL